MENEIGWQTAIAYMIYIAYKIALKLIISHMN